MVNNTKKRRDKPLEWYWNILQAGRDLSNSGYLAMHLRIKVPFPSTTVFRYFHFPFPKHIPHIPIQRFLQIYYEELEDGKFFYETYCLHCQKPEVICIIGNGYLDEFMRYDQLKKCMNSKRRD